MVGWMLDLRQWLPLNSHTWYARHKHDPWIGIILGFCQPGWIERLNFYNRLQSDEKQPRITARHTFCRGTALLPLWYRLQLFFALSVMCWRFILHNTVLDASRLYELAINLHIIEVKVFVAEVATRLTAIHDDQYTVLYTLLDTHLSIFYEHSNSRSNLNDTANIHITQLAQRPAIIVYPPSTGTVTPLRYWQQTKKRTACAISSSFPGRWAGTFAYLSFSIWDFCVESDSSVVISPLKLLVCEIWECEQVKDEASFWDTKCRNFWWIDEEGENTYLGKHPERSS